MEVAILNQQLKCSNINSFIKIKHVLIFQKKKKNSANIIVK